MKKYYRRGVFMFLFLFVFVFGVASLLQAAEITYVEGNVQVQVATQGAWKKADKGMRVNGGDSIRTARRSKADIVLDDAKKNTVRIEEQTLVVLNSSAPGIIDRFDLSNGKLYANVESIRSGMTFEISTPSSVAGVRGTGYSIESRQREDEAAAYNRDIFVKAFDQNKKLISEVTIPEGFKTIVERFGAPSELIKLTDAEMQRWNDTREDMSTRMQEGAKGREEALKMAGEQENLAQEVNEAKNVMEERKTEEAIDETRGGSEGGCEEHY